MLQCVFPGSLTETRLQLLIVQGFSQNDAAIRFLQSQRTLQQGDGGTAAADATDLYNSAADLLSKAGMSGEQCFPPLLRPWLSLFWVSTYPSTVCLHCVSCCTLAAASMEISDGTVMYSH